MTTKLEREIRRLAEEKGWRGVRVLWRGNSGGHWSTGNAATASAKDRNNAAQYIREHGDVEIGVWGTWYSIPGAYVAAGAGVDGGRGRRAKMHEAAIVMEGEDE